MEYGYSCMGYEIAGGLGVKLAAPEREVYVLVGDGSYLMLSSELVTAVQEGVKLTIVLVDNHGYNSIGSLSRSLGTDGFGTLYRHRRNGSLGVDSDDLGRPPADRPRRERRVARRARDPGRLDRGAPRRPEAAKAESGTTVIAIEVDRYEGVPGYESWWDVAVAEVSRRRVGRARRGSADEAERGDRRGGDGPGRDRPLPERARDAALRGRTYTRFVGGFAGNVATGSRGSASARRSSRASAPKGTATTCARGWRGRGRRPLPRDRPVLADPADLLRGLAARPLPDHVLPPADRARLAALARRLRRGRGGGARLLYATGTGLAQSPSRETTLAALRAHRGTTIFDLDWRPTLWDEPRSIRRSQPRRSPPPTS